MQPIISIIGKSESGKTTLLEALIAELKQRGYRVAVIKHTGTGYDFDTPNKDSWRFRRAGAGISAIASAEQVAIFKKAENYSPEEFARLARDCDLILTEGYKQSNYPRIEVHRKEQGAGLLSRPEQLIAVVTDEPLDINVPQFTPDNITAIAGLIESRFLKQTASRDIDILCNGSPITTTPFFLDLLARTLEAIVPGAVACGKITDLQISLRRLR
ncbi:MAG: molybdopterin-guanine dinucleotide biosynthesis protein B [Dehalococcoidales bacterium]|nr:molybdopterin-guanine dinucleotide biosynthesis protein B [Dehalococcoidales bacterium]